MTELKIGDVVMLKSGGPKMTINSIGKQQYEDVDSAWCDWFEKTAQKKGVFPLTSLKIYSAQKRAAIRVGGF